jgi:hypothetical protein
MAVRVRRGVWETNSSSVHVITFGKPEGDLPPGRIVVDSGEYGWCGECTSMLSYLMTATYGTSYHDRLLDALGEAFPDCSFEFAEDGWYGVDHSEGLVNLVEALCEDPQLLRACILSGEVELGNDNDGFPRGYDDCDDWEILMRRGDGYKYVKGN